MLVFISGKMQDHEYVNCCRDMIEDNVEYIYKHQSISPLILSSIYTFNTLKNKAVGKHCGKR